MLRPLPYFHFSILRRLLLSSRLPQDHKMASAAPAITSIYQRRREKEMEKWICLILLIYSNSYWFSALLLFHLLCFSRLASVGYISDHLALGFLMGPANRDPWQEISIWEENELRILFPLTPFLQSHLSDCISLPEGYCSQDSLHYLTFSLPVPI